MVNIGVIIISHIAALASEVAIGSGPVTHLFCLLVTKVYILQKQADSIKMSFGVMGWVDPRYHVLDGSLAPSVGGGNQNGVISDWYN